MGSAPMKIGGLAKRTGVSVRTLHYYEQVGLLTPSNRTHTGHRVYFAADVARLHQIKSLQQLGFSLAEIRLCLAERGWSAEEVVRRHLDRLRDQIELLRKLTQRLELIEEQIAHNGNASLETLLESLEMMSMTEKYYSPEQQEWLKAHAEEVGSGRIQSAETEWADLMAQVRAAIDAGTDPSDPSVRALAQKWFSLIEEFTGGNEGISQS